MLIDDLQCLLIIQMPDNVFLFIFFFCLSAHVSNSVFFEFTQHIFPVILPSFSLHTHTHTHTHAHTATQKNTFSVVINVGAPEEEITWTQHTTCGPLHIF